MAGENAKKRNATSMTVSLESNGRVLVQLDVWHLVLSAILRSEYPFSLSQTLREAVLTARVKIDTGEIVYEVPQPPEFREVS